MSIEEKNNRNGNKPSDWEGMLVGVFIGFILTLLSQWFIHRHDNPYDWCANLSKSESSYCMTLYDHSIDYQKKMTAKYGDPIDGAENDYGFR